LVQCLKKKESLRMLPTISGRTIGQEGLQATRNDGVAGGGTLRHLQDVINSGISTKRGKRRTCNNESRLKVDRTTNGQDPQ